MNEMELNLGLFVELLSVPQPWARLCWGDAKRIKLRPAPCELTLWFSDLQTFYRHASF